MASASYILVYSGILVLRLVLHATSYCFSRDNIVLTPESRCGTFKSNAPLVSVVIPARNEKNHIASCLASLLNQDYPNLEIIVVDDRSTDNTFALVEELAEMDSRVRALKVDSLPTGWTGKTHAIHHGVQSACGDWLLFVDCDTRHHPTNLTVVMEYAQKEQVDAVSLLPALENRSFWERAVQPLASVVLMTLFPSHKINSPRYPKSSFANGQYILVHQKAYWQIGGHEAVRGELLEDICLARAIKQAGLTLRVAYAPQLLSTRMFSSLGQIVRGWSRILYGAVDHRPLKLIGLAASMVILGLSASMTSLIAIYWIIFGTQSSAAWTLLEMSIIHASLIVAYLSPLYRRSNSQRAYLLLYPLSAVIVVGILARAIWHCFRHNIQWRGTIYGPELLRSRSNREERFPNKVAN